MRGSPEDEDWDWSSRTIWRSFRSRSQMWLELGYLGFESQRLALGTVLLIHGERGALVTNLIV